MALGNYINPFTGRPFQPRFNVPEVFGEALSYEDQILWLAKHFKALKDFIDGLNLATFKGEILAAVAKQNEATLEAFMITVDKRLSAMEAKVLAF